MKICVAQISSKLNSIQENIEKHKKVIELAASKGAESIVFPELSLTGYILTQAKEFAFSHKDQSLWVFHELSNVNKVTIGIGMPIETDAGVCISMILFHPNQEGEIYSKKYLHNSEKGYYVSGEHHPNHEIENIRIAFSICYEISITDHAKTAFREGAEIYIASVAKSQEGVEVGEGRLSEIARENGAPVLMANSVGQSEGFVSAGKTAVWDHSGKKIGQLDERSEGILIHDTNTDEIFEKTF